MGKEKDFFFFFFRFMIFFFCSAEMVCETSLCWFGIARNEGDRYIGVQCEPGKCVGPTRGMVPTDLPLF